MYVGVAADIYSASSCPEISQNLSVTSPQRTQPTDQKSQQMCRTSIGSCFLSRKNGGVELDFQCNCRLQISNFRSGFLLTIFSGTPPVAFSTEFSKAFWTLDAERWAIDVKLKTVQSFGNNESISTTSFFQATHSFTFFTEKSKTKQKSRVVLKLRNLRFELQ